MTIEGKGQGDTPLVERIRDRLGIGVPVEAVTESRAARMRARSREEKSDLIVIDESRHADFLESKPLASDESLRALWIPRYHEVSGVVFTTRWDTPLVTITPQKKQKLAIIGDMSYRILKKPDTVKEVNLDAIPLKWSIGRVVPQRLLTIESALRQQDEVFHDYKVKGPEFARVEEMLSTIRALSIKFIRKHPMRDGDYAGLRGQVDGVLSHHGLEYAASPVWQKVEDKIGRAIQRDRLGRNNPSASRFILSSALLGTVRQEVITGLTRDKSSNIYSHLLWEREAEREQLSWAKDCLDEIRLGATLFIGMRPREIADGSITSFRGDLRAVDTILSEIRVAPYLQVATISRVFLMGKGFRTRRENEEILERLVAYNLGGFVEGFKGASVEDHIMKRDVWAVLRDLDRTYRFFNLCLADPQNIDVKVF